MSRVARVCLVLAVLTTVQLLLGPYPFPSAEFVGAALWPAALTGLWLVYR